MVYLDKSDWQQLMHWPFIQLYDLNPTGNVVIQYNKGGGVQTTTLTFDTVDQFAKASLDKAVYTTVHKFKLRSLIYGLTLIQPTKTLGHLVQ